MRSYTERDKTHHYLSAFHLNQIFSEPDSLPIHLYEYERGEVVLQEGDDIQGLYFQVEGQTKVSSSVGTGKSLLLRFCHPLSIFGDIEFFQKTVIQSQVEAVQPARFLFISNRTIETKLMQDHKFLHELLKHLSYKLQTCTTASRINLLASVEERLASYLWTTRLASGFGKEMQTPHLAEIASLIGTTPRHLNRVIQHLCELSILQKEHKRIVVLDWEHLENLSNGLRYE